MAKETPNSFAEPYATQSAIAKTQSRKSSLDLVFSVILNIQGITRVPTLSQSLEYDESLSFQQDFDFMSCYFISCKSVSCKANRAKSPLSLSKVLNNLCTKSKK